MSTFDILDYLNDMYLHKLGSNIDVQNAGGQHNIHGTKNKQAKENILEINKKRIHIPNAEIRPFSNRRGIDDETDNEPETTGSTDNETGEVRDQHSKPFDENISPEIIEI